MKLNKILCIIGVIFFLSLFFIAGGIIKSYRDFKKEAGYQLFPGRPLAVNKGLSRPLPQQSVTASRKAPLPLNLRLLGTVLGDPAIAYIEDLVSERKGRYEVGDIISGAKIIEIQSGKVTLERNGLRELLILAGSKAVTRLSPTEMIVSKKGV